MGKHHRAEGEPPADTLTAGDARRIGEQIGVDWGACGFPVEEFAAGLAVEREHGPTGKGGDRTDVSRGDPLTEGKIAWVHLLELPDYYTRLSRMESEGRAELGSDEEGEGGPSTDPADYVAGAGEGGNARRIAGRIVSSVSRHCACYRAADGRWYLEMADDEYGEYEDADVYGPFASEDSLDGFRRYFPNPGGGDVDESGTRPAPTKSPNGGPVLEPVAWATGMGYSAYSGWQERPAGPRRRMPPIRPV